MSNITRKFLALAIIPVFFLCFFSNTGCGEKSGSPNFLRDQHLKAAEDDMAINVSIGDKLDPLEFPIGSIFLFIQSVEVEYAPQLYEDLTRAYELEVEEIIDDDVYFSETATTRYLGKNDYNHKEFNNSNILGFIKEYNISTFFRELTVNEKKADPNVYYLCQDDVGNLHEFHIKNEYVGDIICVTDSTDINHPEIRHFGLREDLSECEIRTLQ